MTRRLLAVLFALTALLSACGDDEKSGSGSGSASGSGSGSGTHAEEAAPKTEADLKAMLLTQADVPAQLKLQPTEEGEEEEEAAAGTGCLDQEVDALVPPAATATAEFVSDDQTRTITHEVRSYKDEDEAEKSMEEGLKLIDKCRTFEETDDEGNALKGSFKDLEDFPDLGDDTVAVAIEVSAAGATVTGDFVVVRKGALTTSVGTIVFVGKVDHALAESLAKKAVAKLG